MKTLFGRNVNFYGNRYSSLSCFSLFSLHAWPVAKLVQMQLKWTSSRPSRTGAWKQPEDIFITMKYPFALMDISLLFHLISIAIKKKSNLIYDAAYSWYTTGIFPRISIQSLILKNGFGADNNIDVNTGTYEALFIFFYLKYKQLVASMQCYLI